MFEKNLSNNLITIYEPNECTVLLDEFAHSKIIQAILLMNNIKFDILRKNNVRYMSKTGAIPLLVINHDNVISGSEEIMEFLTPYLNDNTAYRTYIHKFFTLVELYLMWNNTHIYNNFTKKQLTSCIPFPLNYWQLHYQRGRVKNYLSANNWSNLSTSKVVLKVRDFLNNISEKLGQNVYMMGEKPTSIDAIIFGHIYTLLILMPPSSQDQLCFKSKEFNGIVSDLLLDKDSLTFKLQNLLLNYPSLLNLCHLFYKNYFSK